MASETRTAPTRGSLTAERIKRAAAQLFYEQGFASTSVKEITAQCGITAGALYTHFASKEELLYAILRKIHDETEAGVTDALISAGGSPTEQLRAITKSMVYFHTSLRIESLVSRLEWKRLPASQANEMLASERRFRRTWESVLRRGVESGEFRFGTGDAPADLSVVAKALLDMCTQVAQWYRPHGPRTTEQIAEQYAVMALQLVGVAPAVAEGH